MAVGLKALQPQQPRTGEKRSLLPRLRPDLEIVPQYWRGELHYVVKDPVRFHYFRVNEAEYFVLQELRTPITMDELRKRSRQVLGFELEERDIQQFLAHLAMSNLLSSRGLADSERLADTARKRRRMMLFQWFANYLFIRVPLWDPDRALNRVYPWFGWLFSKAFTVMWCLLIASALYIVVTNFGVLVHNAFSLLSGWNLVILSMAIFLTKLIHETGHAVFCKHYGGECHEMGFALLVFNPCMYCDTTDAWRFPSKWRRIAVGAAGMITEVTTASIAALIWVMADPGLMKTFMYSVMVTSSVSTVLFNANPLLRFDGYYILMDYVEIPNFRTKSTKYLGYWFRRYLLGVPQEEQDATRREKVIYMIYGIAAWLYRWLISFAIMFVLFRIFAPMGVVMLCSTVYGQILKPVGQVAVDVWRRFHSARVRTRFVLLLVCAAGVLTALWMIPVDYIVQAPCEIGPTESRIISAPIDGFVARLLVQEGQAVNQGDVLAIVVNEQLEKYLDILKSRELTIQRRRALALVEDPVKYMILGAELKAAGHEADLVRKKLTSGTIRAPFAGVVCMVKVREAGERKFSHPQVMPYLSRYSARVDEFRNAYVRVGVGMMQIARPAGTIVRTYVRQQDIVDIMPGQVIEAVLAAEPGVRLKSTVKDIAPSDEKDIDNPGIMAAAESGKLPSRRGISRSLFGGRSPLVNMYRVTSTIDVVSPRLRWGMTGKAHIIYRHNGPIGLYWFHKFYKMLKERVLDVI